MKQALPALHAIREAAQLSGLPASTLRYYEDIGLLGSIERDASSGHRRYSDEDLDLAVAIACLSAAGLSIEQMRAYLANRQDGVGSAAAQVELLAGQQRRLRHEQVLLRLRQRYIDHKLAYWQAVLSGDDVALERERAEVREIAAALHTPNVEQRGEHA